MAQVLVRDLDPAIVEKLKARAADHGRSLQAELKAILEAQAVRQPRRKRVHSLPVSDSVSVCARKLIVVCCKPKTASDDPARGRCQRGHQVVHRRSAC